LKPEEIKKLFNLPDDVQVLPVTASNKTGVYEAFEVLIDKITGGI
jgi:hypothetical protein